ncbi:MAG: hypothetical protein DDT20_01821 [Firmicutes bacterium]|nr:hypothetical protein [Bacillota bacterium]
MKTVDRIEELRFLEAEYARPGSSFVIVYGRRRLGKTHVLREFLQGKPGMYYLATEEADAENVRGFQAQAAAFTGHALLAKGGGFSWNDLFDALCEHSPTTKKVIAIDEFQYLGKANRAFPSVLQKIWDERLKDANIMLILCGSLITMMYSQTLAYDSPLYGRRTGQLRMRQIPFRYYHEFFPDMQATQLIEHYAVTGGVPKYVEVFRGGSDIYQRICENILTPQGYLYEEPIFLLEREVSEPSRYLSIVKRIAHGNHKLGHLAASLGITQNKLTEYLATLINLDLVERQVPVTESNPEKSKRGLYFLRDNFIAFWFRFVFPYRSQIEMQNLGYVLGKLHEGFVFNHVSHVFERICMEWVAEANGGEGVFFKQQKVGRWWNDREEIDIVALNEDTRDILFGECKYSANPVDTDVFYALRQKSAAVKWHLGNRQEHYALFSKTGFTQELHALAARQPNLKLREAKGTEPFASR